MTKSKEVCEGSNRDVDRGAGGGQGESYILRKNTV